MGGLQFGMTEPCGHGLRGVEGFLGFNGKAFGIHGWIFLGTLENGVPSGSTCIKRYEAPIPWATLALAEGKNGARNDMVTELSPEQSQKRQHIHRRLWHKRVRLDELGRPDALDAPDALVVR